jgi:MOSC domain-containing protein YiiM
MAKNDAQFGRIVAVCAGSQKGAPKRNVGQAQLAKNFGLSGDCDAGPGGHQLALIQRSAYAADGDGPQKYGALGENLVVEGIDLASLAPGSNLRSGDALMLLAGPDPAGGPLFHAKVLLAGIVTEGDLIHLD